MSTAQEDNERASAVLRRALPPPLPAELGPEPRAPAGDARPDARWRSLVWRGLLVGARSLLLWCGSFLVLFASDAPFLRAGLVACLATAVWSVSLKAAFVGLRLKRSAVGTSAVVFIGSAAGSVALSALAFWGVLPTLTPPQLAAMTGMAFVVSSACEWARERILFVPRRVLIAGVGSSTIQLIETIQREPVKAFDVVGVVGDEQHGPELVGLPLLGRIRDLPAIIRQERPDLVVVAVDRNRPEVFSGLLEVAEAAFSVVGLPEFYEQSFGRLPVRDLSAAWFMSVLHLYQRPYPRLAKRISDVILASTALLMIAPLLLLLALLVRRTPGPAIFRQTRLGEGGRPFTIYKFRTMREDAEAAGVPLWAAERDPRVTRIGRVLRKSRIDELPQLVNVLKGDMTIVGPRPERPEYLDELTAAVPFWATRHLLKPGITGWAQVSNGYAWDHTSTERKLSYDLWYLRHRSFAIDMLVCAKTVKRIVSGWGAR